MNMKYRKVSISFAVVILFIMIFVSLYPNTEASGNIRIELKDGTSVVTKKTVFINPGQSRKLKVYLNNHKIKNSKITFKSTKKAVVSIHKTGLLKAKKAGTAKIKVSIRKNGKKYKSWIRVKVMKQSENTEMENIKIQVKDKTFQAKIYHNDAGKSLLKKMPFTLDMKELNGNEKYYYLEDSLKTASKNPGQINLGDIKLYGEDCLVVFYKSFSTSYRYTDIGYIVNPEELAQTLGSRDVKITFKR